jgi:hypothetical protein
MSYTIANFRIAVKTKIRGDIATPAIDDLHDNSITQWGDEHVHQVMQMQYQALLDMKEEADIANVFEELITYGQSVTFSSGSVSRPSGIFALSSAVVTADSVSNRNARILPIKEFRRYDGRNFVLTPTEELPIITLAGSTIKVAPTTITAGKIDFIKDHATIASGILLNPIGYSALVYMVMAEYYEFIGQDGKAEKARQYAKDVIYGDSRKQIKV